MSAARKLARNAMILQRPFRSRRHAGHELAARLSAHARQPDVLVLALPRGGVPVAFEVAGALQAPLDVFLVRKLGVPGDEELAMGAIASGGVQVLNSDVIRAAGVSQETIDSVARREQQELARRESLYRGDRGPLVVEGRFVILVDDGLATGSTMRAAAAALRRMHPSRILAAVPVGAPETCDEMRAVADEVVCLVTPQSFMAVGSWYDDFSQTSDEEVSELLRRSARQEAESPSIRSL
jgi:predicted phosphoribosyltransferase